MSGPKVTIQISEAGAAAVTRALTEVKGALDGVAGAAKQVQAAEAATAASAQKVAAAHKQVTETAKQVAEAGADVAKAQESVTRTGSRTVESLQRTSGAAREVVAQKAAAADAAAAFGRQSSTAMDLARGAANGLRLAVAGIARAANLLPALGFSGALVLIYKGALAAAQAIRGVSKEGETFIRIYKGASVAVDSYADALKRAQSASTDVLVAMGNERREMAFANSERARTVALVAEASREIRRQRDEIQAASSAQRNARTIDQLAAANERLRTAQRELTNSEKVLAFARIQAQGAEERYRKTIDDVTRAENDRRMATARRTQALNFLTGGLLGVVQAEIALGKVRKQLADNAPKPPAAPPSRRMGPRRRKQTDLELVESLGPVEPVSGLGESASRRDLFGEGDSFSSGITAVTSAVSGASSALMELGAVGGRVLGEQAKAAEQAAKQQTAMTNALVGSAQAYGSAALAAVLYGGSVKQAINATARAAFIEGTLGALGALAKAAVFSIINPPAVGPMLAAAKTYGIQAAIAGTIAAGTGGLTGGGGAKQRAANEAAPQDFGRQEAPEREDREMFINFASGQSGGRPLSRADASAIVGALVEIARVSGGRLEVARA